MKKLFFATCLVTFLFSCESDDPTPIISSTALKDLMTNESNTTLIISKFIEEGVDDTNDFSGYVFQFNEDNTVVATKGDDVNSGTYRIFVDDGKTELELSFPNHPEFSELNDDWYYISNDGTTIKYEDAGDIIEFSRASDN